ncbi:MAG: competence/damage-inducible protein A, partial [Planctomycetes bacterium]|nr:competence/damage-inducible protein A [Planctomycetota bacterium]
MRAGSAARLADRGVPCVQFRVVPDDLAAQAAALRELAAVAQVVIVTGGLGPTDDDLTREALRVAMGDANPLVLDAPSLEALDRWFTHRGRAMPDINRRQAMRPSGAECLRNDFGTA